MFRKIYEKSLKNNKGEGYIDVVVLILCAMLILGLAVNLFPIYISKQKLDTFATEILREAEIAGRIASETNIEEQRLKEELEISPTITWSKTGNVQLNHEIKVTATLQEDIGLFGEFGSFKITLRAEALGKSEKYWK